LSGPVETSGFRLPPAEGGRRDHPPRISAVSVNGDEGFLMASTVKVPIAVSSSPGSTGARSPRLDDHGPPTDRTRGKDAVEPVDDPGSRLLRNLTELML
jgi:hypothetical protein